MAPDATTEKNLNASRPSEHPPVRGGNVKTLRWDHRLQRQNLEQGRNNCNTVYDKSAIEPYRDLV